MFQGMFVMTSVNMAGVWEGNNGSGLTLPLFENIKLSPMFALLLIGFKAIWPVQSIFDEGDY